MFCRFRSKTTTVLSRPLQPTWTFVAANSAHLSRRSTFWVCRATVRNLFGERSISRKWSSPREWYFLRKRRFSRERLLLWRRRLSRKWRSCRKRHFPRKRGPLRRQRFSRKRYFPRKWRPSWNRRFWRKRCVSRKRGSCRCWRSSRPFSSECRVPICECFPWNRVARVHPASFRDPGVKLIKLLFFVTDQGPILENFLHP